MRGRGPAGSPRMGHAAAGRARTGHSAAGGARQGPRTGSAHPSPRKGGSRAAYREGGNLISKAHQLAGRVFSRVLKKHGIKELNPAQGRIVYELWKQDGITQAELASRAKLDKSTLALMLDRLEDQGQIVRDADPADARRRIIRLTAENRSLHAAYNAASQEMIGLCYRGFSNKDMDAFEAALRAVVENLERALIKDG